MATETSGGRHIITGESTVQMTLKAFIALYITTIVTSATIGAGVGSWVTAISIHVPTPVTNTVSPTASPTQTASPTINVNPDDPKEPTEELKDAEKYPVLRTFQLAEIEQVTTRTILNWITQDADGASWYENPNRDDGQFEAAKVGKHWLIENPYQYQ